MPSTRSTPYAAQALLLLSLSAVGVRAQGAIDTMTYVGCFSSSQPLTDQGWAKYQTTGYCRPICEDAGSAVFGLSDGSNCWCGDQLPAANSKVSDSQCDVVCNGYGEQNCGGDGAWSVYTVQEGADVSNYGGGSNSNSNTDTSETSTTPAPSPTTTNAGNNNNGGGSQTTAKPSVITSIAPGQTIVKTVPASEASSVANPPKDTSNSDGGGGTNVGAIAAGVVVGVLAVAAIAGGLFWFMRRRKRQAAEDEYNRNNQVSDFMGRGGERKPPQTGYSQMSDSRLDPEAGQRRDSQGSIADNQDYSRRILRVANPDGSN